MCMKPKLPAIPEPPASPPPPTKTAETLRDPLMKTLEKAKPTGAGALTLRRPAVSTGSKGYGSNVNA